MSTTRIGLTAGEQRARLDLAVGKIAPRLISRGTHSAHVGVTAAEMLLLGGDRMDMEISVGPGCELLIEDIGGTGAYPVRDSAEQQSPAEWNVTVRIAAEGRLLWKGLPFVVATGADVMRRTAVELGAGARVLLRETLVLGRHGETGGRIRSTLEVTDPGGPVLLEDLMLAGAHPEPGVLGDHRVADAVIAAGFRPLCEPGDLVLEEPGAVARRLDMAYHCSPMGRVWERWVAESRARQPSDLEPGGRESGEPPSASPSAHRAFAVDRLSSHSR